MPRNASRVRKCRVVIARRWQNSVSQRFRRQAASATNHRNDAEIPGKTAVHREPRLGGGFNPATTPATTSETTSSSIGSRENQRRKNSEPMTAARTSAGSRSRSRSPRPFPCRVLGRLLAARAVAEILEKVAARRKHHGRVVARKRVLIGLHRTIEAEEVGILAEGLTEDARLFRIALAAQNLRLARRFRRQHGDLACGARADALRCLVAFGAVLRRLALAFLLHALVDGKAVGLR